MDSLRVERWQTDLDKFQKRAAELGAEVGVDASSVGYQQAYSLSERARKGNYVLIGGSPSDSNAAILHDAQTRVLQPLVDRGDIKIVPDRGPMD